MPTSITIPDVPDDVRNELTAYAAACGQSLEEYLRAQLLSLTAKGDNAALMDRVRRRKATLGGTLSTEEILAHLDADRR